MKVLKEDSDLYQRILKAENYLEELNLRIHYWNASDGLIIEDTETGQIFLQIEVNYEFPRSIESRFRLRE